MKKCKNGFTLIELLVVIVLIISILGIAIVSVTKLSEKQKENALEKVKDQVVTAAEQYFSSNEYLFEGIEDTGYGIITVGNLVKDDYLNKLTDPTTGKALNECDQVKVQRNNDTGKFIITYLGANGSFCNSEHPTFKINDKAPDTGHYFAKKDDSINEVNKTRDEISKNNGWYNYTILNGKTLRVVLTTNGSYVAGRCDGDCPEDGTFTPITTKKVTGGFFDDISYNSDMDSTTYTYKICNGDNCALETVEAAVDTIAPICNSPSISVNYPSKVSNGWYNSKTGTPTLTLSATDERSGFFGTESWTTSATEGKGKLYEKKFTDKAGNISESCTATINYDKTAPSLSVTLPGLDSSKWHSVSSIKYKAIATDDLSGIKTMINYWNKEGLTTTNATNTTYSWNGSSYGYGGSTTIDINGSPSSKTDEGYLYTQGHRKTRYTVCDVADNCSTAETDAKIDRTKPTLALTLPNISDNSNWYNYDIDYKAVATDDMSGIGTMNRYWNKSGLNSTTATSAAYSWNSSNNEYKSGGGSAISLTKGTASKTHQSYLSAEGHRKIRYTVCDQAGNCVSAAKDAKIDKTPPVTPTLTSTPTICQVYGSGYANTTATQNKVIEIVQTSPFKASSCTNSFTYTGGKFNGKLGQQYPYPGSFILYAEYKSSDALSGLDSTTMTAGYSSGYGWSIGSSYLTYGGNNIGKCSYENGYKKTNGYPCTIIRTVTVKDRAGNVSAEYKATYNNLSY